MPPSPPLCSYIWKLIYFLTPDVGFLRNPKDPYGACRSLQGKRKVPCFGVFVVILGFIASYSGACLELVWSLFEA
jgi:hypothetical protein